MRRPAPRGGRGWRLDPRDLLFVDETSTPITLTPLRARAPRGQRAVGRVPRGKRPHIAWLATLPDGDGGESGRRWPGRWAGLRHLRRARLGAQLAAGSNRGARQPERAQERPGAAADRSGRVPGGLPAQLFARLNPIEAAFAKTKQALRRLEPRTWESVVAAIGQVVNTVSPADARAFFTAAGFTQHDTLPHGALG